MNVYRLLSACVVGLAQNNYLFKSMGFYIVKIIPFYINTGPSYIYLLTDKHSFKDNLIICCARDMNLKCTIKWTDFSGIL